MTLEGEPPSMMDGPNVRHCSDATSFTIVPVGDLLWHIPTVAVQALEAAVRAAVHLPSCGVHPDHDCDREPCPHINGRRGDCWCGATPPAHLIESDREAQEHWDRRPSRWHVWPCHGEACAYIDDDDDHPEPVDGPMPWEVGPPLSHTGNCVPCDGCAAALGMGRRLAPVRGTASGGVPVSGLEEEPRPRTEAGRKAIADLEAEHTNSVEIDYWTRTIVAIEEEAGASTPLDTAPPPASSRPSRDLSSEPEAGRSRSADGGSPQ